MSNSALLMAQITRLRREFPQMESAIRSLTADTQFMLAAKENFDARQLLERANQSTRAAQSLREQLTRAIGEAQSVVRSVPRAPVAGHAQSSMNVADISASLRRVPELMSALERALLSFTMESRRLMNSPGRWGDLMAEGTGVHLWWSTMNNLLEWWRLEKQRQKLQ